MNQSTRLTTMDTVSIHLVWRKRFSQRFFNSGRDHPGANLVEAAEAGPDAAQEMARSSRTRPDGKLNLEDCLAMTMEEEVLGDSEQWYCPDCKEHKNASKKLELWRLPDVLVLHLKRFEYTQHRREKLETEVIFQHELDLTEHVHSRSESAAPQPKRKRDSDGGTPTPSPIYELYAVSSKCSRSLCVFERKKLKKESGCTDHFGGYGGGHYTAFAKCSGSWCKFDDSHVTRVEPEQVQSAAAYVSAATVGLSSDCYPLSRPTVSANRCCATAGAELIRQVRTFCKEGRRRRRLLQGRRPRRTSRPTRRHRRGSEARRRLVLAGAGCAGGTGLRTNSRTTMTTL